LSGTNERLGWFLMGEVRDELEIRKITGRHNQRPDAVAS